MESLWLLIPLSIGIVLLAIWIFFRASDSGQFDDLVGPGLRILQDDDQTLLQPADDTAAPSHASGSLPKFETCHPDRLVVYRSDRLVVCRSDRLVVYRDDRQLVCRRDRLAVWRDDAPQVCPRTCKTFAVESRCDVPGNFDSHQRF